MHCVFWKYSLKKQANTNFFLKLIHMHCVRILEIFVRKLANTKSGFICIV